MILENYLQGRKKSVWISASNDLFLDAKRDLDDVGYTETRRLLNLSELYKNKCDLPKKNGCLYLTYTALAGENGSDKIKRLKRWLGKHFSGIVSFYRCTCFMPFSNIKLLIVNSRIIYIIDCIR